MRFQRLLSFLIGKGVGAREPTRKALLIIDMQKSFLCEHHPGEVALMIQAQIELIRECKKQNLPIVVVEYKGNGSTIPELQVELSGYRNLHFVVKKFNSAFSGTGLRGFLDDLEVEDLILAGVNASYCVFETAQSAVRCGFGIITSEKLISDSPHNRRTDKSLWWYRANGELLVDLPQLT